MSRDTEFYIEKIINDRRRVRIDDTPGVPHLYTMTNGSQWTSCRIDDVAMAKDAIAILQKFIDRYSND